jgi:drug/metabolite transporter (DMT)-like permease
MSRSLALLAATVVAIIYGVTFTIAKDVMPKYIEPYGFIVLRVFGATLLFWGFSFFVKQEKIDRSDYFRIILTAFFGVALNMLTFFKGLSMTTPISASVLMVTTPMLVLILSAIILKEKLKKIKVIGIILGLIGTFILITYQKDAISKDQEMMGNFLVFVNALSYGYYLILVKKLMDKYNPLTFVKWIYTIGFIMVLPFGFSQIQAVDWQSMPNIIIFDVFFIVVFSTFLTYLLNLISMKKLTPTAVSVFIYMQPVFATVFAISLGKDQLNPVKILSALLIFGGVFLVVKKKNKTTPIK